MSRGRIESGCLCVIVRSASGSEVRHIGRFVTAVRRSPAHPDAWVCDPQLFGVRDGRPIHWLDTSLHPIRGQKPTDTTHTADELIADWIAWG